MQREPAHASVYQVRPSAWLRRGDNAAAPVDAVSNAASENAASENAASESAASDAALDAALSAKLVPYARSLGFTHIALTPQGEASAGALALPLFEQRCAAAGLHLLPADTAAAQASGLHGLSFDDPWQTGVAAEALRLLQVDHADRAQRFATLRACLALLWGQPGCQRVAMGAEFAQQRSWPAEGGLDWHLLADPLHEGIQRLMHDLNHLRRELPALRKPPADADPSAATGDGDGDAGSKAFLWLERDLEDGAVLAFARQHAASGQTLLVLCSFAAEAQREHDHRHYRLGVPHAGRYTERLFTGSRHYGGDGLGHGLGVSSVGADWPNGSVMTEAVAWGGFAQSLVIDLPANCTLMLEHHR